MAKAKAVKQTRSEYSFKLLGRIFVKFYKAGTHLPVWLDAEHIKSIGYHTYERNEVVRIQSNTFFTDVVEGEEEVIKRLAELK